MSTMSYEEARRYIAGDEFDTSDFERQHLLRLTESVSGALAEDEKHLSVSKEKFLKNTMQRAERYIKNHIDTPHKAELRDLMRAYLSVSDYYDAHFGNKTSE